MEEQFDSLWRKQKKNHMSYFIKRTQVLQVARKSAVWMAKIGRIRPVYK